jgi:asparagine synthase (glutamine-hydrolysing)
LAGQAKGIQDDPYYGYELGLLETVEDNFQRFGIDLQSSQVQLVPGLFQETLRPTSQVALAHIDGDWHDSVSVCLHRIWPLLSPGGVIVIDDYDDWSGCRQAVDDFLAVTPDVRTQRRFRLLLIKDDARP